MLVLESAPYGVATTLGSAAVGVDLQQGRDAVLVTATGQADALVWASS